jgi:hypothetical protein
MGGPPAWGLGEELTTPHRKKSLLRNVNQGHSEDLDVDGWIILKWILGKQGGKVWTGCIWLRVGTSGGLLSTWVPQKAGNILTA